MGRVRRVGGDDLQSLIQLSKNSDLRWETAQPNFHWSILGTDLCHIISPLHVYAPIHTHELEENHSFFILHFKTMGLKNLSS